MVKWPNNIFNPRLKGEPPRVSKYKSTSNALVNHLLSTPAYNFTLDDHLTGWIRYRTSPGTGSSFIQLNRYDFPIDVTFSAAGTINLKFSNKIQTTLNSKLRVVKDAKTNLNKYGPEIEIGNQYLNNYTILFGLASVAPGLSVNRIVKTAGKLQRPSIRKGRSVADLQSNLRAGRITSHHTTNFVNDAQRAFWDVVLTTKVEKSAVSALHEKLIGDVNSRTPRKFRRLSGHLKRDTVIKFKRFARSRTLSIKVPGTPDSRVHLEEQDRLFVDIDIPLEKMAIQGLKTWMQKNVNLSLLESDTVWELLNFSSRTKEAK